MNVTHAIENGLNALGIVPGGAISQALLIAAWVLFGVSLLVAGFGGMCCFRPAMFLIGPVSNGLVLAATVGGYVGDPTIVELSPSVMLLITLAALVAGTLLTLLSTCCCGGRDIVWAIGAPVSLLVYAFIAPLIDARYAATQMIIAFVVGIVFVIITRHGPCAARIGPSVVAVIGGSALAAYAIYSVYASANGATPLLFASRGVMAQTCAAPLCVGSVCGTLAASVAAGTAAHALYARRVARRQDTATRVAHGTVYVQLTPPAPPTSAERCPPGLVASTAPGSQAGLPS